jgi:hypothetical protein
VLGRSPVGDSFGDGAIAAAMIDRIVNHAGVLTLKGVNYRLSNRGFDTLPSIRTQNEPVASHSPVTSAPDSTLGVDGSAAVDAAPLQRHMFWG